MHSYAKRVPDNEHLAALLARCTLRDENAFADLYQLTSAKIFGVLLRVLRRRDWAEEALQETYLRVWSHAKEYRPDRGAPMVWLISIARYRAFDQLRRRNYTATHETNAQDFKEALSEADPALMTGVEALYDDSKYRALQDCLAQLEDNQRQSLMLAFCEGFTHAELSYRMHAPLGTVKSWIRRGLQQLKQCMQV